MIGNVVLPGMKKEDWPGIREALKTRILGTFGMPRQGSAQEPGVPEKRPKPEWKELERAEKHGLMRVTLKYRVVEDHWNEAILIFPEGGEPKSPLPAIVCIHGSNGEQGKNQMVKPGNENSYGIELAQRGYVTLSVDQFAYGAAILKTPAKELIKNFYEKYPGWTLDGIRLLEQVRSLDVLENLGYVKKGSLGIIGHSMGGRAVTHLAALDDRVKACVSSAGISPNCTNVYRRISWSEPQNPIISKFIKDSYGRMPWDYHELLSLCAPRAFMAVEPYNDDYNPDAGVTFQCIRSASEAYALLGAPEKLLLYCHGEMHHTPLHMREDAYHWLDRHLKN
jgi:dienelactone hydrolase